MKKFENDIINSINVLHNAGIILYPTDTIWGIGCDATNAVAIRKIYLLKKREEKKSMIILLAQKNEIKNYVLNPSEKIIDFLSEQKNQQRQFLKMQSIYPKNLLIKDGSIAIRIVKDDFCQMLIGQLSTPLVSTSANISGRSSSKFF